MAYDKVIDSRQLDNDLTSVANAIRSKAGIPDVLQFPQGFVDAVNNMSSAEGVWEKMQNGTLTEYVSESKVMYGGFSNCTSLKTVDLSYVNALPIGAFASCYALETVASSRATRVENYAFQSCNNLRDVDLSSAVSVGIYAFCDCNNLCEISLPRVKILDSYVFRNCTSLKHVDIPLCTSVNQYSFQNATSLEEISLPSLSTLSVYTFYSCTALKKVDLPVCTQVNNLSFYNCSSLKAVILRRSSAIANLGNANAFSGSGVEAGTGYIYVPANLVDSYKIATSWKTYATQFRALEDYTVDGTITGELDESKI